MDVQSLRDNYPKLISRMEASGYSACYVSKLKREINRILSSADSKCWTSYSDIYLEYTQKSSSPSYLRNKLTFLGVIEHFDVRGQYPNGQRRQKLVERGKYRLLAQEFKSVIDCYCAAERLRGKKEAAIYVESHSAASFLFALQQSGIDAVEKITEEAVLSVFLSEDGSLCRSCSYKKNVAVVFKACITEAPETFAKILAFLPELRETRKNIQYLKPEEVALIKQALTGKESGLSLRDRAIGILALYTGLRCCDIAGLIINDVDWDNERICIRQQKTGVPLELPLSVAVGNAIFDYLAYERPEIDCGYMFISSQRPFRRLTNGSLVNISNKIMKASNIRQSAGERRGFHLFRHRLATELLGNGVPQPVISRTLGHTSPNSLEAYLSADFKHLKECALSIEGFPVSEGVFGNA
jgi:integrase